jgi:hypothetical protein
MPKGKAVVCILKPLNQRATQIDEDPRYEATFKRNATTASTRFALLASPCRESDDSKRTMRQKFSDLVASAVQGSRDDMALRGISISRRSC